MPEALNQAMFDQLFRNARTFNRFTPRQVEEHTIRELYDLLKWGPTSMNCQPARYVFLRSAPARERLKAALSPGNVEKTLAAPLTVIIAIDTRFYEFLPEQFSAYDAQPLFKGNPVLAENTAFRNGTLQGAYIILAARALGLDCGPMSGFDNAKVDAEFFPDGRWKSNFLVNIGYGDPAGNYPRGPRLPFETVAQVL